MYRKANFPRIGGGHRAWTALEAITPTFIHHCFIMRKVANNIQRDFPSAGLLSPIFCGLFPHCGVFVPRTRIQFCPYFDRWSFWGSAVEFNESILGEVVSVVASLFLNLNCFIRCVFFVRVEKLMWKSFITVFCMVSNWSFCYVY